MEKIDQEYLAELIKQVTLLRCIVLVFYEKATALSVRATGSTARKMNKLE